MGVEPVIGTVAQMLPSSAIPAHTLFRSMNAHRVPMQVHESKAERESRFCEAVARIVLRGGRCLLPVFALGRAQELLLILDELWAARPELQHVPIFFSSHLASRSLDVYKTYIAAMNPRITAAIADRNPWDFRFVRALARPGDFRDEGP